MNANARLTQAFTNAPILPIRSDTKYVFFSDCHRGTGNKNDNFLPNATLYLTALQHYYQENYWYIEAGDGDELWENCTLQQIMATHADVFALLRRFHAEHRMYMLYGNHDMVKKDCMPIHEGLIFYSPCLSRPLCVTHGHQADYLNSVLWKYARFLVCHFWKPLEQFGISDPTSAAKNNTKKGRLEKRYLSYAKEYGCLLMTGHTHRPTLCDCESPYCNCGSCVHPNCVTCIELYGYQMHLVKWCGPVPRREVLGSYCLLQNTP